MEMLLTILILILLVIIYELWKLIQLFQQYIHTANPFLNNALKSEQTFSELDPLFKEAIEIVTTYGKASASLLQRKLNIGYARSAKIVDQLETEGYVGPAVVSTPRPVIKNKAETK